MYPSIHPSVRSTVCRSIIPCIFNPPSILIYSSIYPSIHLFTRPCPPKPVHPPTHQCPSIQPPTHSSIQPSIHPSIHPNLLYLTPPSTTHQPTHTPTHPSI